MKIILYSLYIISPIYNIVIRAQKFIVLSIYFYIN